VHGPAESILFQRGLPRQGAAQRWQHPRPQPRGAALPLHHLWGACAAMRGTPYFRLRSAADLVTLLCHGGPLHAVVAAFDLDERTVATWWERAGAHCVRLHGHLVQAGQADLGHVQADELWIKLAGRHAWQAMALAVPSRLWLGGVISPHRGLDLNRTLIRQVRACACGLAVLVCADGPASYVRAVREVFRQPVRTGRRGRPRLVHPAGLLLAQVVKHTRKRQLVGVTRRVVVGSVAAVQQVLSATGTFTQINTACIERLNATFSACLVALALRAAPPALLTAAMYLVGTAYNFCWPYGRVRERPPSGLCVRGPEQRGHHARIRAMLRRKRGLGDPAPCGARHRPLDRVGLP
jgi:hypothetical protein